MKSYCEECVALSLSFFFFQKETVICLAFLLQNLECVCVYTRVCTRASVCVCVSQTKTNGNADVKINTMHKTTRKTWYKYRELTAIPSPRQARARPSHTMCGFQAVSLPPAHYSASRQTTTPNLTWMIKYFSKLQFPADQSRVIKLLQTAWGSQGATASHLSPLGLAKAKKHPDSSASGPVLLWNRHWRIRKYF